MCELRNTNELEESSKNPVFSTIPFDIKKHWMFHHDGENYELSITDIKRIDELLNQAVTEYNLIEKVKFVKKETDFPHLRLELSNYTIALKHYKRQYLAVKIKEEKIVFIQCFCNEEHKNWQSEMIHVCDGGKCYFDVYINLTQKTTQPIAVNGEA